MFLERTRDILSLRSLGVRLSPDLPDGTLPRPPFAQFKIGSVVGRSFFVRAGFLSNKMLLFGLFAVEGGNHAFRGGLAGNLEPATAYEGF